MSAIERRSFLEKPMAMEQSKALRLSDSSSTSNPGRTYTSGIEGIPLDVFRVVDLFLDLKSAAAMRAVSHTVSESVGRLFEEPDSTYSERANKRIHTFIHEKKIPIENLLGSISEEERADFVASLKELIKARPGVQFKVTGPNGIVRYLEASEFFEQKVICK